MQYFQMYGIEGLFVLYYVFIIVVLIFLIRLLCRFVSAHERAAAALETVARKMKEDGKLLGAGPEA